MRRRGRTLRRRYGHASARGLSDMPPIGTKVRLTGTFLKNTGQQRGGEGASRWKIIGPVPGMPQHVYVDEKYDDEYRKMMWGDLPEVERPKYRAIALGNLEIVGAKPKAGDYP
jgi:hypothetical protein